MLKNLYERVDMEFCVVSSPLKENRELSNIPVVHEFSVVFPEDLLGMPVDHEIKFAPGTQPISRSP